jgi:hypothetical protein
LEAAKKPVILWVSGRCFAKLCTECVTHGVCSNSCLNKTLHEMGLIGSPAKSAESLEVSFKSNRKDDDFRVWTLGKKGNACLVSTIPETA